jgi:hypothetical protein
LKNNGFITFFGKNEWFGFYHKSANLKKPQIKSDRRKNFCEGFQDSAVDRLSFFESLQSWSGRGKTAVPKRFISLIWQVEEVPTCPLGKVLTLVELLNLGKN